MQYSDLKTQFLAILNRRDITPTLTNTFIGMGIQRIQRELRIPAMESSLDYTGGGSTLDIPGDFLELISLHINSSAYQVKLRRADLQTALRYSQYPGIPRIFYRQKGQIILGPYPETGTTVTMTYYQDAATLNADTDHNWMTDAAPDLLIYSTLSYAADYFLDERKQAFEQRYQQIAQSLQDMATQDELENAAILAAYPEPEWWPYEYS